MIGALNALRPFRSLKRKGVAAGIQKWLPSKKLFGAGEKGVWFDPSDFSTLYQDAAGTTPVTAVGQPVGLILDKSKGLVLGAEVLNVGLGATWTNNGDGTYTNTGASHGSFLTLTSFTPTSFHKVQFEVLAGTITLNNGATVVGNAVGTLTAIVAPGAAALRISGPTGARVRPISVRELPGNHASQSTATSRPILGQVPKGGARNLLKYSEQFDNAAWSKTNVTITANADTAPDGTMTADRVAATTAAFTTLAATYGIAPSTSVAFSLYVKKGSGPTDGNTFILRNLTTATNLVIVTVNYDTGVVSGGGASNAVFTPVGDGWYRITLFATSGISVGDTMYLYAGFTGNTEGAGEYFKAWGAQFEAGAVATPYQRTTELYDVYEPGQQHLNFLHFDGVDDWLATQAIDFSTVDVPEGMKGPELVTNGTFATDTAGWTPSNATLSIVGGAMRVTTVTGGAVANASAPFTTVVGKTYFAKFKLVTQTNPLVFTTIQVGTAPGGAQNLSPVVGQNTVGEYTFTFIASATTSYVTLAIGNAALAGNFAEFDNVSIREIPAERAADKMTVVAGVRKLSDATIAVVCELSANPDTTNGSLSLRAPGDAATGNYYFGLRGDTAATAYSSITYAAPISNIVAARFDLSGAARDTEVFPRINGAIPALTARAAGAAGGGNFGNHVLYIGRRGGASLPAAMRLYPLIIRAAASSDAQIAQAERYVNSKTGAF